ncbi:hypothetical protein PV325_011441 [Microctonus aethiopoides]|nr:hypothetical protein PV325_011441 [Microctonus aethiopoides]
MPRLRGRAGGNIGRRTRNAEIIRFRRLNRTAGEHLTDNVNLGVQVANTRANESLEQRNEHLRTASYIIILLRAVNNNERRYGWKFTFG